MNKYTFTYIYQDDGVELTMIIVDIDNCMEVVRNLSYFLKGVSFQPSSIKTAFEQIASEIGDSNDSRES